MLLLTSAAVVRAQDGRAAATAPATAPTVVLPADREALKPAADAAWAVLQALRDYVHAAQILNDPPRRTEEMAKAKETLNSLVGLRPGGDPDTLATYVSFWPPVVARYVDGFQPDRLHVLPGDQQVQVIVVAANPEDKRIHDELFEQITQRLQGQGYAEESLVSRRQIDLVRELAQKGIGYPIEATFILTMRQFNGQWKATELDLQPPRVPAAGTQPVRSTPGAALKPSTQPAQ